MENSIHTALKMLSLTKPKNYGNGEYISRKAIPQYLPVEYANPMELVFMYWMDQEPDILQFRYENLEIPYRFNNKIRMYHPDFEVLHQDRSRSIWELKQTSVTGGSKTTAKKKAAIKYAAEHGYKEYKIFTLPDVRDLMSL